jgi:hypothetical protein
VLRRRNPIPLTAKHEVATRVNGRQGKDVIPLARLPEAEAKARCPAGVKTPKLHLRVVPRPE